jgi:hypothetical protein
MKMRGTAILLVLLTVLALGCAPAIPRLGESRSNPLPAGSTVTYNDEEVRVLNVEKTQYSDYQDVKITIQWRNLGSPDESEYVSAYDFALVGEKGKIYEHTLFIGEFEEGHFPPGDYFGGVTITGTVRLMVDLDDTDFIMIWNSDGKKFYLELE